MIYILLNLRPILAATALSLLLGAMYHVARGRYRPVTVSRGTLVVAVLGTFWFASILAGALILAPPKAAPWIMAVGTAVVIWAGFVLPVVAITLSYRRAAVSSIVGDSLYWLAAMVAQAVMLKMIGLVPPPT